MNSGELKMTKPQSTLAYWSEFPVTYRTEQVALITKWLVAEESGVVIGISGSGKSNLAGFLGSRPDAISPYISRADRYCFLHLDINSLPALTTPFFYRALAQTLQDASEQLDTEVQQAMKQLVQAQTAWNDAFSVLTLLRKMHHLLIRQAGKKAIWLLDRFDEASLRLEAQTLNSLRSLRDQFKGQLCYVVFTRHPLARLRNPSEFDEFHEIVARNICWIGAMVERDARWIAHQMAQRLQTSFSEAEVKQLLAVSGRLPAFLKLGCLALAEGTLGRNQPDEIWVKQLLAQPQFERNCEEIWDDLTVEERNALLALVSGAKAPMLDPAVISYLEHTGLLIRSTPGAGVNLFSPLLEAFVAQQRGTTAGMIKRDPRTRVVSVGGIPLNVELTTHEDRLLAFFLEHPGEVCEKDTLIQALWPNDQIVEGIRDDRLAQLIKRLREKIEIDPARPTYIQTVRGQGYRFAQPET
jgi:DNA-binding winged helix-turn-helix (wHTH) protein